MTTPLTILRAPPLPANEPGRLEALRAYRVLDTPPEAAFDDLTRLAARICGTPIALVSLIDAHRQWFKSRVGLDVTETPRDQAFCSHAIVGTDQMVVPDATQDDRFATNPLVTDEPHIRFYAGQPLTNSDGYGLGTLCVIDREPRQLDSDQLEALRILGLQVTTQLELRRSLQALAASLTAEEALTARLRASEERFYVLAEEAPVGIFETDVDGRCLFANRHWLRIAGMSPAQALGSGWVQAIHPEDRRSVFEAWQASVRERRDFRLDYRFQSTAGEVTWVEGRSARKTDQQGELRGYLGSILDITGRRDAQRAMEEASRVKTEFASMVSHELRTPLTAIKEGVDIVLDGTMGELNSDQVDCLGTAKRNIDRLSRLIHDVLDYQKFDAGRMEFRIVPHDLGVLLENVVATFSAVAARKQLRFDIQIDPALPMVPCDRDKIEQVLANFCNNAVKFTVAGTITLRATIRGGEVEISVEDHGPGIRLEDQAKLFESFSQLSQDAQSAQSGTGLGLAISRKIVTGHGGQIGVRSEFGRGATFFFTLPLDR
ncbi:MAG: ATP-binding protein [Gemmatimonadales bacterium]